MCMVDDADGYNTFSSEYHRKARKQHQCGECFRMIEPGETYYYLAALFDGQFCTSKHCEHCHVCCTWLVENCRGYLNGAVIEDVNQHIEEYAGRAKCIPRLARLAVSAKHDWRWWRGPRKGQLMPVPSVPAKLEPANHH